MISQTSGKPITHTSLKDARGFALGIAQLDEEPIGRFWFYEGETLGYRAVYIYVPCNGVIISAIMNSATNEENDHSHGLILQVWQALMKDPSLHCATKNG